MATRQLVVRAWLPAHRSPSYRSLSSTCQTNPCTTTTEAGRASQPRGQSNRLQEWTLHVTQSALPGHCCCYRMSRVCTPGVAFALLVAAVVAAASLPCCAAAAPRLRPWQQQQQQPTQAQGSAAASSAETVPRPSWRTSRQRDDSDAAGVWKHTCDIAVESPPRKHTAAFDWHRLQRMMRLDVDSEAAAMGVTLMLTALMAAAAAAWRRCSSASRPRANTSATSVAPRPRQQGPASAVSELGRDSSVPTPPIHAAEEDAPPMNAGSISDDGDSDGRSLDQRARTRQSRRVPSRVRRRPRSDLAATPDGRALARSQRTRPRRASRRHDGSLARAVEALHHMVPMLADQIQQSTRVHEITEFELWCTRWSRVAWYLPFGATTATTFVVFAWRVYVTVSVSSSTSTWISGVLALVTEYLYGFVSYLGACVAVYVVVVSTAVACLSSLVFYLSTQVSSATLAPASRRRFLLVFLSLILAISVYFGTWAGFAHPFDTDLLQYRSDPWLWLVHARAMAHQFWRSLFCSVVPGLAPSLIDCQ